MLKYISMLALSVMIAAPYAAHASDLSTEASVSKQMKSKKKKHKKRKPSSTGKKKHKKKKKHNS